MTKVSRQSRRSPASSRPKDSAAEGPTARSKAKAAAWGPSSTDSTRPEGARLKKAAPPPGASGFSDAGGGRTETDGVGAITAAGAAGAPAATAIDVTDDAALARLTASVDPRDKELAKMIKTARTSYAGLIRGGARVSVVANDAGNSGRPVVTITPKALVDNPTLPFAVQVHYHGMDSTADHPNSGAGLQDKLATQLNGPPPRVFVMPTPTEMLPVNGRTYPIWTSVQNTRATADQALKAIGLPSSGADRPLTVSAHSAGGRAVAVAQAHGGLDCDRLELEDCLYGVTGGRADSGFPPARDAALAWAAQHPGTPLVYVRSNEGGNGKDLTQKDLPAGMPFTHRQVTHHYDAALG